jgi:hypothetical protein
VPRATRPITAHPIAGSGLVVWWGSLAGTSGKVSLGGRLQGATIVAGRRNWGRNDGNTATGDKTIFNLDVSGLAAAPIREASLVFGDGAGAVEVPMAFDQRAAHQETEVSSFEVPGQPRARAVQVPSQSHFVAVIESESLRQAAGGKDLGYRIKVKMANGETQYHGSG